MGEITADCLHNESARLLDGQPASRCSPYTCLSYWQKAGNGRAICQASRPYTKAVNATKRNYATMQRPEQLWNLL
jgi:hypothetical protein